MLLSTLRLSLSIVPANQNPLQCLEVSGKGCCVQSGFWQSCKPTGLWLELVPSQYRTSSVIGGGPIMEDKGNLTIQNPMGGSPLPCFKSSTWAVYFHFLCWFSMCLWRFVLYSVWNLHCSHSYLSFFIAQLGILSVSFKLLFFQQTCPIKNAWWTNLSSHSLHLNFLMFIAFFGYVGGGVIYTD